MVVLGNINYLQGLEVLFCFVFICCPECFHLYQSEEIPRSHPYGQVDIFIVWFNQFCPEWLRRASSEREHVLTFAGGSQGRYDTVGHQGKQRVFWEHSPAPYPGESSGHLSFHPWAPLTLSLTLIRESI